MVLVLVLCGMKTPMAWAAERFDRHHAIGAWRSAISSRCLAAASPGAHPPPAAGDPAIVMGIPVKAVGREVDCIVRLSHLTAGGGGSRPRIGIAGWDIKMEAPASDQRDRLTEGSGDRREKLFVGMKGHLQTPSPDGDREESRRQEVPPARETGPAATCRTGEDCRATTERPGAIQAPPGSPDEHAEVLE